MDAKAVLSTLRQHGLRLSADGANIRIEPKSAITPEFRGLILDHKPALLSILNGEEPANDAPPSLTYTAADLAEMDALLLRLSELEGWEPGELEAKLGERRRMAPVNVQNALQALRVAAAAALAGWPEPPAVRAQIVLCRLVS